MKLHCFKILYQLIYILFLRGPAGADADGGVVVVRFGPGGEGVFFFELFKRFVFDDREQLIGGGGNQEGNSFFD